MPPPPPPPPRPLVQLPRNTVTPIHRNEIGNNISKHHLFLIIINLPNHSFVPLVKKLAIETIKAPIEILDSDEENDDETDQKPSKSAAPHGTSNHTDETKVASKIDANDLPLAKLNVNQCHRPAQLMKRRSTLPAQHPEAKRQRCTDVDEMSFELSLGVGAWKNWVHAQNAKSAGTQGKLLEIELLQLTADQLNESLAQFVREVRKPNGMAYAPDTIYYLMLGIQVYLNKNGRHDNIFTDPQYEGFAECFDEIARKFSVMYNDLRK